MEIVAGLFVLFGLWLLLALPFCLIATGSTTWPSEDPPYHSPVRQQRTKWSNDSDRKSSTVQTPETSPRRREFRPEQIIDSEPTVQPTIVGSIMELPPYCCFQGQELRVARIMMRENHLQSLPVVDVYKRIAGTITMRDIAAFEENRRK
jgi:CBS domain-containing protein